MKIDVSKAGAKAAVVLALCFILTSCGLLGIGGGRGGRAADPQGELVGAELGEYWVMDQPYGMVPIPAGTFHMGQADEDPASTQINFNKQVTIGPFFMDDTEITNNEYRQFTNFFLVDKLTIDGFPTVTDTDFRRDYYPDSTVWVRDFAHHMGDPIQDYYFWHPGYNDYPVVGIDWEAAVFFCEWRTAFWNDFRKKELQKREMPAFRLPSEAEWEYASRGGRDLAKYPWGNPYIRNSKGCMLANFKPGRGNFFDDGYAYTSPIMAFFPNDWGLWDTSGNVSEWCLDDFNPASVPTVWDLNPQYIDPRTTKGNAKYDDKVPPKKVVRGGSWKDVAYYLETGTRAYEYRDSSRAYIGFRCALTNLGRSSGAEFGGQ
jgi:formylglycine-generating enzyme